MRAYNSYRSYLRKKFGRPVLKVPLNGGFCCPNRDGTLDRRGCSFCDNRSFSPVAETSASMSAQLDAAIKKAPLKHAAFLAYLQPFSNTYGSVDYLRSIYEPILAVPQVVGLAIGTRPDCFDESTYAYLGEVNRRTYLSVELGLQSSHNATLARIRRGHTWEDFVQTVNMLHSLSIETAVHVMLGLPGEQRSHMICTAQRLAGLPVRGIKIHQLMIISGTDLETEYRRYDVAAPGLEAYAALLAEFLSFVRPDQHIHRLMASAQQHHGLIAPLWSSDKMRSINYIQSYLREHCVQQGSAFRSG
ncbi:MAG: TIGR01212 family radical SAM protein [Chitinivibrionales bacterium]|nr:TIGR01212 family radical SAM protein [Chitinivibrionales bacterium]